MPRLPCSVGIGADHPHLMALGPQGADQIHGSDGGTVVFLSQHIANHRYDHSASSHSFGICLSPQTDNEIIHKLPKK